MIPKFKDSNIKTFNNYRLSVELSNHGYFSEFSIPIANLSIVDFIEESMKNLRETMKRDEKNFCSVDSIEKNISNGLVVKEIFDDERIVDEYTSTQKIIRKDYIDQKTKKIVKSEKVDKPGYSSGGSMKLYRKEDIGKKVKDVKKIKSSKEDLELEDAE